LFIGQTIEVALCKLAGSDCICFQYCIWSRQQTEAISANINKVIK